MDNQENEKVELVMDTEPLEDNAADVIDEQQRVSPLEEAPNQKDYFAVVFNDGRIEARAYENKKSTPDKAEKDPNIKMVTNIYPAKDDDQALRRAEKIIAASMAFYEATSKRMPEIDPDILLPND